jgi:hypothetical protein
MLRATSAALRRRGHLRKLPWHLCVPMRTGVHDHRRGL